MRDRERKQRWMSAMLLSAAALGAAWHARPAHAADGAPDLDALVTHETRVRSHNGVERIERWQERWTRRADHVWIERVRPNAVVSLQAGAHDGASDGHRHFDVDAAARHIVREADGSARIELIDDAQGWTVAVPRAEYGPIGFDGRWDRAAYLTPPALIERLPVDAALPVPIDARGIDRRARWRVERVAQASTRVLWSEGLQAPLRIEARRNDGSFARITTVKPMPRTSDARLPWKRSLGYARKEYDDFLD